MTGSCPIPTRWPTPRRFIRRAARRRSRRARRCSRSSCRARGRSASWASIRTRRRAPEVGYWLGRPFWGRGYRRPRRSTAVLAWARDGWGRRCVIARHFADNPASGAVLIKAGFLYTGRSAPGPAARAARTCRRAGWCGWPEASQRRGTPGFAPLRRLSTSGLTTARRRPIFGLTSSVGAGWRLRAAAPKGPAAFLLDRKAELARQDRRRPEAAGAARPRRRGGGLRDRAPAADGRRPSPHAADHGRAAPTATMLVEDCTRAVAGGLRGAGRRRSDHAANTRWRSPAPASTGR